MIEGYKVLRNRVHELGRLIRVKNDAYGIAE